ncbi:trypsin-like serine protease [Patulibacter sp.]|uniref:S1 family peptidase n=1 Tax=Patulibacter sp. TaxID=1912859 RepID=UPI0027218AB4|nr:trypsin-like serine protease [Patulibacter sp.]MDO9409449.1 trypsin-like serine protease [Patulibacter sp.]
MTARPRTTIRTSLTACAVLAASLVGSAGAAAAPGDTVRLAPPAAPAPAATSRIVGGTVLPDTTQAPYTVAIFTSVSATSGEGCSGTVVDSTHVVTAAHCFIEADGTKAAPSQVTVVAGTPSYYGAPKDPGATTVGALAVRTHPRYVPAEFDDDVAVVTLARPLDLGTGRIAALPLPPVGSSILPRDKYAYASRAVQLTGFGITATNADDFGTLRTVGVGAIPIGFCGTGSSRDAAGTDAPAILLCSDRRGAGACQGDSGGTAAVGPLGARVLAGVIDTSGADCQEGRNLYANVAAPEIRTFIDAALREQDLPAEATPLSPRGGGNVKLSGRAVVGRTVTCRRGSWRSGSRFRYAFVFVKGTKERNRGLSTKRTYKVRSSDRGWSVSCAVQARNAGGTGATFWPFATKVRTR